MLTIYILWLNRWTGEFISKSTGKSGGSDRAWSSRAHFINRNNAALLVSLVSCFSCHWIFCSFRSRSNRASEGNKLDTASFCIFSFGFYLSKSFLFYVQSIILVTYPVKLSSNIFLCLFRKQLFQGSSPGSGKLFWKTVMCLSREKRWNQIWQKKQPQQQKQQQLQLLMLQKQAKKCLF